MVTPSQTRVSGKRANSGDTLAFVPSARLQRYLGRELIADPNLAVIEFVKNSYDAGASIVTIRFALGATPSSLVIADDGIGMDLASFRKNWMRPGYSAKSPDAPRGDAVRPPASAAGRRMRSRQPVGEKGLGRLAAARLGQRVDVYTRTGRSEEWLHVPIDWSDFDDMTKAMSDVRIPYEHIRDMPLEDVAADHGTVIVVTDLDVDWARRLPGRPAFGRSRTRLGRLRQDLDLMLRPLGEDTTQFAIDFQSDEVPEEGLIGLITPDSAAQVAHYTFDFELTYDSQDRPVTRHTLRRSAEMSRQFDSPRSETFKPEQLTRARDRSRSSWRPSELACGPFSGRFLYNPPPAGQRAKADDVIGHGVLLYRDDVIVEPYGLGENDWVGVEARKAQRQGHDLVQPSTFWGEVHINREENPDLVDMANRQGLLENAASIEFVAHVRAEFEFFERMVTEELEKRWEKPEETAAKTARSQLTAVTLASRSFAHQVRQSLMGMGAELVSLELMADRDDLPSDAKRRLRAIHKSLRSYLERTEELVSKYAKTPEPEFERTSTKELLSTLEREVAAIADAHNVIVSFSSTTNRGIIMPRALVHDALRELIVNAIEADRPGQRAAVVTVRQVSDRRDLVVVIEDNGVGMPGVKSGAPLRSVHLASTKGRQAGGITEVANVVAFSRGEVNVTKTDSDGTAILVRIPGRIRGLE